MLKCELHGIELEDGTAQIRYGLVVLPENYREAREKRFPNADSFVLGVCMIGESDEANVKFCRRCRRTEKNNQGFRQRIADFFRKI